jgi:hypothetical protein
MNSWFFFFFTDNTDDRHVSNHSDFIFFFYSGVMHIYKLSNFSFFKNTVITGILKLVYEIKVVK